jgi:hypothetical protein
MASHLLVGSLITCSEGCVGPGLSLAWTAWLRLRCITLPMKEFGGIAQECGMPGGGGERQGAGSCAPPGRRRKRASLYQPMLLGIANKAAAAVLLSVSRGG